MFRRLLVAILFVIPMHGVAQDAASLSYGNSYEEYAEYSPAELEQKYRKFIAIRNIGLSFAGVAAASLVTGIVLMTTSDIRTFEETKAAERVNPDTVFSDEEDIKFITGITLLIATTPFSATGITMAAIGGNKRREYKHKMVMRGMEVSMSIRRPAFSVQFDVY